MKNKFLYSIVAVLLLIVAYCTDFSSLSIGSVAKAESFPTHRIEIIVPFAPGGGSDAHARALQKVADKYLKQPLVVINKAGGGGDIGFNELAKSAPDGYTWGMSSPDLILQSIYGRSKYHYLTALDPIAQICTASLVLVVNADSPWHNVDDVIRYAKEAKEPLVFAHSGIGSSSYVLGEIFAKLNDIKIVEVPFRGGSEKTAMLLGKHVDMMFHSSTAVLEQVKAGKLRVLASASSKRLTNPLFANVPTFKELGIDIELNNWYGIATPKPMEEKLKREIALKIKEMTLDPAFEKTVEQLGTEVEYLGPEESQEQWIKDAKSFKKMVNQTGMLEQLEKLQPST